MTRHVEAIPEYARGLARLAPKTTRRTLRKIEWLAARPERIPVPMKHPPHDPVGSREYDIGDHSVLFRPNSLRPDEFNRDVGTEMPPQPAGAKTRVPIVLPGIRFTSTAPGDPRDWIVPGRLA